MENSTIYKIVHFFEDDTHDFNTRQIPFDLLLPLSNYLRSEYRMQSEKLAAYDFKMERAKQNDRYVKYCQENQENPKQIFIDFPNK